MYFQNYFSDQLYLKKTLQTYRLFPQILLKQINFFY